MFDRCTQRALLSIFHARKFVFEYGSATLDTEHMLLGILESAPSVVMQLLPSKTTEQIRAEVKQAMVVKPPIPETVDIPLSEEGSQIFTFASEEAHALRHRRVDIAHMVGSHAPRTERHRRSDSAIRWLEP